MLELLEVILLTLSVVALYMLPVFMMGKIIIETLRDMENDE